MEKWNPMKNSLFKMINTLIILLLTFGAFADNGKPDLWQFEKSGVKNYLFGSIHLGSDDMYPLSKTVKRAYKATDELVVEFDFRPEDGAKMIALFQKYGFDRQSTLESRLSHKGKEIYKSYCVKHALPCKQFAPYKAWFLSIQVMAKKLHDLGYREELGIDKHFLEQAHEMNKSVFSLESPEMQFSMLANFTNQQQEAMLIQMLESDDKQFTDMFDAWKTGNDGALIRMLKKDIDKPGMKDMYKQMLDDRNFNMVDNIEKQNKTGKSLFVVVGAGHIIGQKGLVNLLRDKGYQLTQLQ